MAVPTEFESFCNAAMLAFSYDGATLDDFAVIARRSLDDSTVRVAKRVMREALDDEVALGQAVAVIRDAANRHGWFMEGDLREVLRAALVQLK